MDHIRLTRKNIPLFKLDAFGGPLALDPIVVLVVRNGN